MTLKEQIEACKDIASALPGAQFHIPGYGDVQSTQDGTIIIDRGVEDPLEALRKDANLMQKNDEETHCDPEERL